PAGGGQGGERQSGRCPPQRPSQLQTVGRYEPPEPVPPPRRTNCVSLVHLGEAAQWSEGGKQRAGTRGRQCRTDESRSRPGGERILLHPPVHPAGECPAQ